MLLSSSRSSRRTAGFRPRVESLEARWVPTTLMQNGSQLFIRGTPGRDVITLGDNGQGGIAVLLDGSRTPVTFSGISQVSINTGAGNDLVHYDLVGGATISHGIGVDLGTGNDTFMGYFNGNDIFSGANFGLAVAGHSNQAQTKTAKSHAVAGTADRLSVDYSNDPATQTVQTFSQVLNVPTFTGFAPGAVNFGNTPGVDIAQGATLRLALTGGAGHDVINVNYYGTIGGGTFGSGGTLNVVTDGRGGADAISVHLTTAPNSGGRINASEQGGSGNDKLTLAIRQQQNNGIPQAAAGVAVNARLNGGSGRHDVGRRTANVVTFNCEVDILLPLFPLPF